MGVSNAKLLLFNAVDLAVIDSATAGPETLPASHLKRYGNSRVYRSSNKAHTQIKLTWTEPQLVSGIALWRHTLSDSATWQIRLYENPDYTGENLDTDVLQAVEQKTVGELDWLIDSLVAAADQSRLRASDYFHSDELFVRSAIIDVWDADNDQAYIDIARLYMGRVLSPSVNLDWGTSFDIFSSGKQRRTAGGSVYASALGQGRKITFSFSYVNEFERPHLANGLNHVGISRDFYFSLYPGAGGQKERQYAMAAKFERMPSITHLRFDQFSAKFSVIEA